MTKISDTVVDPNRGIRNTIVVLSILISLLGLVWAAGNVWVLLILILNSLALISMAMIMYPYVVLREDGVAVRFFFKEQFYRWDQILQAGRYRTEYKKQPHPLYFSLVLVGPNGSEKSRVETNRFCVGIFARRSLCPMTARSACL